MLMDISTPAKPISQLRADAAPFTLEAAATVAGILPCSAAAQSPASGVNSSSPADQRKHSSAPPHNGSTGSIRGVYLASAAAALAASEGTAAAENGGSTIAAGARRLQAQPSIVERMMMKEVRRQLLLLLLLPMWPLPPSLVPCHTDAVRWQV